MESKHTKGEWTASKGISPDIPIFEAGGTMIAIAWELDTLRFKNNEAIANAKLIAAAPDLLESLQRFMKFAQKSLDSQPDKYESSMILQAKEAIRKATE